MVRKNDDVRNSLVLDVGVVGPWSYGEEAYRTKEFKGQEEGQTFGTVSLNWTF